MNIPNALTLFRLFLIPAFVLIFFSGTDHNLMYSTTIFLVAGFTDVLDGYIARKYNLITKWGIVMDPLADKLMLTTVLACLVVGKYIPLWILIIVAAKEVSMIIAGMVLYKNNTIIPSNIYGKVSTFLFYLSIFTLGFINSIWGDILLYIAVASALVAYVNYFIIYYRHKETAR